MEKRLTFPNRKVIATLGLGLSALMSAAPAAAQVYAPVILPALSSALSTGVCPVAASASLASPGPSGPGFLKASAILGGASSALETIRARQDGFETMGPLMPGAGTAEPPVETVSTTAALALPPMADCASSPGMAPARLAQLSSPIADTSLPGPNDFLASRRVPIAKTSFDASWDRVNRERGSVGRSTRQLLGQSEGLEDKLATVNRWVNQRITYKEDSDLFGQADYWAGPRKTLRLGQGDCEDYALLKMHMLAAAGVPREDMFLTITRDLVRRADHAVLIVRTPDGFRMLDNASDTVLDASAANDYRPVLSFSGRKSWLHGY